MGNKRFGSTLALPLAWMLVAGCAANTADGVVHAEGELYAIADDDTGSMFVLDRGHGVTPRFVELELARDAADDAREWPAGAEVFLDGVQVDGAVFTSRVDRQRERARARDERAARRRARREAREARRRARAEARAARREARRREREARRAERCEPEPETEVVNVLTIAGDYVDVPLPCDVPAIQDVLFTGDASVDAFYRLTTFEAVGVSGDVVGPFPLSLSSTDACDSTLVQNELIAAAEAEGVDTDAYDKVLFMMPRGTCAWNGRATLGGRYLWSQYCNNWYIAAHELGHTLDLGHAATPGGTYGDRSDVMGAAYCGFNAPHHVQKGWLSADTITESGTFEVGAISSGPGEATILKIERASDALFVSFRVEAYAELNERYTMDTRYVDRVSIHTHSGTNADSIALARLAPSESFTDPESGVTITHDAFVGSTASVTVSFE